jgi:lipoate-protein ligase A
MIAGALNVDPTKFQSKSSKSVRSRIGSIRAQLQEDMDLGTFWSYLKTALAGSGLCEEQLSDWELEEVDKLRREKYATWEWNFGRSPRFDLSERRRFEGGTLEVSLHVEGGHITDIAFFGDFLSRSPLEELEQALKGCAFRREDVQIVLERFPMRELFGTITQQEVLDTVFFAGDVDL